MLQGHDRKLQQQRKIKSISYPKYLWALCSTFKQQM